MTAYSFQPRFVDAIRDGSKGGTIRAARKIPVNWSQFARDRRPGGHAIPGEDLSLYCRQRQPGGFLIGERTCLAVEPIELNFAIHAVLFRHRGLTIISGVDLDVFARFDGFADWQALFEFWRATHGGGVFEGWNIRWKELP